MATPGNRLAWAALILGVTGTALVVVPWLQGGAELYTTPKLAALIAGALLAALAMVRHGAPVELRLIDVAWAAHLGLGLLSGLSNGPVWSVPAIWFLPLGAATLLAFAVPVLGTEDGEPRLLQLIIVTTALVAAIALAEACDVPLPWVGERRPHSTLGNRNFVAADAAVGLTLALATLRRRALWAQLALIALLATVVTLTRCRSAWVGLAAAACVALLIAGIHALRERRGEARQWLQRPLSLGLVVAVAGCALGALVPWPGLQWRDAGVVASASRMLEVETGSGRGRLDDYTLATAMVEERPLLGWGPRRWEDASSAVAHTLPTRHASAYAFWATPNSDLARIAGEQGLAGLLTLAALLVALAQAAGRRRGTGGEIAKAALLGLTVYAVHGSLDAPLFRQSSLAIVACLCALLRPASPAVLPLSARLSGRLALGLAALVVLFGTARITASVIVRLGRGSVAARTTAQRFWPRPGVAQSIVVSLAHQGRCAEAEAAASTAMAWSPHHWAVPHFVALCFRSSGALEHASVLRAQALRIEPHLDSLILHHRQGSGDLWQANRERGATSDETESPEPSARIE